jgi:hypothetical protein
MYKENNNKLFVLLIEFDQYSWKWKIIKKKRLEIMEINITK